ncbi:hypothetical protein WN944_014754 [Citrus x changshan-huyou]|uniref:Uncharacterized protein n=1 Tax=Citrus x changshan-huyou TaxID=2935761 RepID=A0AAP0M7P5_9ROSI
MDQRVEQLEKAVENVVGQGDLLQQLAETINTLSIRVEQIASEVNESAGNPNAWMQNQDEEENYAAPKSTPGVR